MKLFGGQKKIQAHPATIAKSMQKVSAGRLVERAVRIKRSLDRGGLPKNKKAALVAEMEGIKTQLQVRADALEKVENL